MLFYDFEVFKEDWLVVIVDTNREEIHEIINDRAALDKVYQANKNNIWIGYNSRRYDQYILKAILCGFNPKAINDFMIVEGKGGWEFSSLLNKYPVINFDIMTSMHSLKQLEGFMGNNIKETSVSFNIDRKLTDQELKDVLQYCRHDVRIFSMHLFLLSSNKADSATYCASMSISASETTPVSAASIVSSPCLFIMRLCTCLSSS